MRLNRLRQDYTYCIGYIHFQLASSQEEINCRESKKRKGKRYGVISSLGTQQTKRVTLDADWSKITKKKRSYRTPGLSIPTYILFSNITLLLKFKFLCIDGSSYFKIILMLLKHGYPLFSKTHVLIESLWNQNTSWD